MPRALCPGRGRLTGSLALVPGGEGWGEGQGASLAGFCARFLHGAGVSPRRATGFLFERPKRKSAKKRACKPVSMGLPLTASGTTRWTRLRAGSDIRRLSPPGWDRVAARPRRLSWATARCGFETHERERSIRAEAEIECPSGNRMGAIASDGPPSMVQARAGAGGTAGGRGDGRIAVAQREMRQNPATAAARPAKTARMLWQRKKLGALGKRRNTRSVQKPPQAACEGRITTGRACAIHQSTPMRQR